MSEPQRYLILPTRGLRATPENASTAARDFLTRLTVPQSARALRTRLQATVNAGASAAASGGKVRAKLRSAASTDFEIVESLNKDGVKLISATSEMVAAMRYEQPGLRVVPEVFYRPARFWPRLRAKAARLMGAGTSLPRKLVVEVVRADSKAALAGVVVVGFTDFVGRVGDDGTTGANGTVTLSVPGRAKTYERVYVQHELPGLWSQLAMEVSTKGVLRVELRPLDLAGIDSLRHFHDLGQARAGDGVTVGVIDSGIALNHPDLVVAGGLGCVPGESETDWGASGAHGTHVAGIIAGRGQAPTGMRGLAPGVKLHSYRVFGPTASSGSNFALVKAIQRGVEDGCELLNMSLSFDPDENSGLPKVDEAVQEAIREAHSKGVLVIAASGNDGRKPVSYPALDDLVVAVSALGRLETFPDGSGESGDVLAPFGNDPKDFVAAFANIGTELDVAGAGVGVVSTVPGGYAPMSGTSMACPAVTGVVARLLAQAPDILRMAPASDRADAIKKLLFDRARSLGFKLELEGKGVPR